jgi:hypothetical protein
MGKGVSSKDDNRKTRSKSVIHSTTRSESTSKSPAPSNRLTNKTVQNSLKNISSLESSVSKKNSNKRNVVIYSSDEDGPIVDIDDLTDGEDEDMVPVENKKKLPTLDGVAIFSRSEKNNDFYKCMVNGCNAVSIFFNLTE